MSVRVTPATRAVAEAGIAHRVLEYDYDPSAEAIGLQAAQAMGIEPARVFKTLVVALDGGELVCAAIPSDARLNLKALAAAAGAKRAEMAPPAKAERATGYVVGGISPFGQRRRLRAFLDESALLHEEILLNGGRRGLQIALAPADAVAALEARTAALSAG